MPIVKLGYDKVMVREVGPQDRDSLIARDRIFGMLQGGFGVNLGSLPQLRICA
jgi:hypothetical protein